MLPPMKLQFEQGEPLQDKRITLSGVGGAQDAFREELDMMGADGVGKRSDGFFERLLHHRDDLGRERRVRKILHGDSGEKGSGRQCAA